MLASEINLWVSYPKLLPMITILSWEPNRMWEWFQHQAELYRTKPVAFSQQMYLKGQVLKTGTSPLHKLQISAWGSQWSVAPRDSIPSCLHWLFLHHHGQSTGIRGSLVLFPCRLQAPAGSNLLVKKSRFSWNLCVFSSISVNKTIWDVTYAAVSNIKRIEKALLWLHRREERGLMVL